jgi:hypothetical protein
LGSARHLHHPYNLGIGFDGGTHFNTPVEHAHVWVSPTPGPNASPKPDYPKLPPFQVWLLDSAPPRHRVLAQECHNATNGHTLSTSLARCNKYSSLDMPATLRLAIALHRPLELAIWRSKIGACKSSTLRVYTSLRTPAPDTATLV